MIKRIFYIGLFILCSSGLVWAEPVLIANPSVSTSQLSRSHVAKIFLGKKKTWDGGEKITPALLKGGAVHTRFVKKVIRKSPSQFNTHWKRLVFTGKGQALKTVASEQEMVDFVSQTAGAVGYVDAGTDLSGVKTIPIK